MLVRVGAERYIIPTVNIQITFRPTPEHLYTVAGRGELVLLRGQLIPLVRLHQLFQVPEAIADPTQALLLILAVGERRCALLVDELLGQQQVVAKSLGTAFGLVPGVSGAAILGDGRVGLILDPAQIIALSRRQRAIGAARGAQEASAA
jgi:two-component system chemotaxis sensor kinase CheA